MALKFGSSSGTGFVAPTKSITQGTTGHASALQSHVDGHSKWSTQSDSEYDRVQASQKETNKNVKVHDKKKIKVAPVNPETGEREEIKTEPVIKTPEELEGIKEKDEIKLKEKEGITTSKEATKARIDWKNVWKNIGNIMTRAGDRYNEKDPGKATWLANRVDNTLDATPDSQNENTDHDPSKTETPTNIHADATTSTSTAAEVQRRSNLTDLEREYEDSLPPNTSGDRAGYLRFLQDKRGNRVYGQQPT